MCAVDDESGSLNAVHENLDDIEYTQSILLRHQLLTQDYITLMQGIRIILMNGLYAAIPSRLLLCSLMMNYHCSIVANGH